MKILVPVDEKTLEGVACPAFGRAPYYAIYDTDTNESTFLENEAAKSAGGAGIRAAQFVVDQGADVVLTTRLGGNAADILEAASIDIYKVKSLSVMDNIDAFVGGKLSKLEEIHPGFHNHG